MHVSILPWYNIGTNMINKAIIKRIITFTYIIIILCSWVPHNHMIFGLLWAFQNLGWSDLPKTFIVIGLCRMPWHSLWVLWHSLYETTFALECHDVGNRVSWHSYCWTNSTHDIETKHHDIHFLHVPLS